MGVIPIELGPYTEGVNLADVPIRLNPNELSLCKNWRVGYRGELYKRPGHDYYGNNSSVTGKINDNNFVNLVLRFYSAGGSKKLIAAAGGLLKYGDDSNGTWTNISINGTGASMNSSNLCDWMVYKDRLYITDGTRVQRYDGTNDLYAGHYSYGAPTLADGGAGILLAGVYKYRVASVQGDLGEGPYGTEASINLGANKKVDLSGMTAPGAAYGETAKKIYRTTKDGSLFYFLVEHPSATTVYTDNISDATLIGQGRYAPIHRPPDSARFCLMGHDDRAYYFGITATGSQSLVEVSDVGFPDRICEAATGIIPGFFTVANNDGDILTGGGLVPGGIVFFKRNSMWLSRAFGYALINIQPREKRGASVGSIAPFSIVSTPLGLIFLSQRGEIYKFDGTNIEEIGRKIAPEFLGMTDSGMSKVIACYHDYRYIISYDYRGLRGYNWRTLEYNTRTGNWDGPHENGDFYNPSYYSVWDSSKDKGELYWGEAKADSRVYARLESSYLDRGSRFESIYRSGALPLGKLSEIKTTKIFVDAEFYTDITFQATHVDEVGVRESITLNAPIAVNPSKWEPYPDAIAKLGPSANVAKFGGITSQVLEGSFGIGARSRKPRFEVTDSGTGIRSKVNSNSILLEV